VVEILDAVIQQNRSLALASVARSVSA